MTKVRSVLRNESGITTIEYAFLIGLVMFLCMAGIGLL